MTDADYIRGFWNNDDRVIARFYSKHRQAFFAFFKRAYSKDDAYIAELFQDSCIKLWRNVQDGKLTEQMLESTLATYLFSIGKYTMMSKDRKAGKHYEYQGSTDGVDLPGEEPEENSHRRELLDFVCRMVSTLKAPCDELLIAQYWYRLSGTEIAKRLGYNSADSVKSQKFKCIRKLRTMIAKFKNL